MPTSRRTKRPYLNLEGLSGSPTFSAPHRIAPPQLNALEARVTPAYYSTTTSLTSSLTAITTGDAVTLTATVTYTVNNPFGSGTYPVPSGGAVHFYSGGTDLGVRTTDFSGQATLTTGALPAGTSQLRASFAGGNVYYGPGIFDYDTYATSEGFTTVTVSDPAPTTPSTPATNPPADTTPVTTSDPVTTATPPATTTSTPAPATTPAEPAPAPAAVVVQQRIVVGAEVGSPAVVRSYLPDGTLAKEFAAFDPGFLGGVRVGTGDVTGDGIPDIFATAGPGGGPIVRAFDGNTLALLWEKPAFEASFLGGVFIAVGDVSGDGRSDVVVTPDEGGGPVVRIFDGASGRELSSFYGIEDPNFRGGARPSLGDVNGDGRYDLMVSAGFGGGPRIAVYDGTQLMSVPTGGTPARLVPDFFAFEDTLRNGAFVALGDLNGDGYADLVCGAGPGGGPRVLGLDAYRLLSGVSFAESLLFDQFTGDTSARGGVRVAVGDLNGTGYGFVIAVPIGGGAASTLNGLDGSPFSGGLPAGLLTGSVSAVAPTAKGGAHGVPGTASWQPGDNWKQVSTKFTPPSISDYVAEPKLEPGQPHPTPNYRGTYTAQFTGSVLATKDGSTTKYTGTIDATVTIDNQTSSDTSGYLNLEATVQFKGTLKADDPNNATATLPLDVSVKVKGDLLQTIATSGPRNQAVGGNLNSTDSGQTMTMRKVSVFKGTTKADGTPGFPNQLQADFGFKAKSGDFTVEKSGMTTGYFRMESAATTTPTTTTTVKPLANSVWKGTYKTTIYSINPYKDPAPNPPDISGTITLTLGSANVMGNGSLEVTGFPGGTKKVAVGWSTITGGIFVTSGGLVFSNLELNGDKLTATNAKTTSTNWIFDGYETSGPTTIQLTRSA